MARALPMLLLLLFGAVMTLIVQAAAVLCNQKHGFRLENRELRWPHAMPTGWGEAPMYHCVSRGPGRWEEVWGGRGVYLVKKSGWPFLSSTCRAEMWAGGLKTDGVAIRTASLWPKWLQRGRPARQIVPTVPLWTGFAANTVFYAAVTAMGWWAAVAVRRRVRRRRGRCIGCGYSLQGISEQCPECGAPAEMGGHSRVVAHEGR